MPIIYYPNKYKKLPINPCKSKNVIYNHKGGKYLYKTNSFNISLNDKIYSKTDYNLQSIIFYFTNSNSRDFSVSINSGYSIVENLNDYLWFQVKSEFPKRIILNSGFYNGFELANHLQEKLTIAYPKFSFLVVYNNTNGKFSISINSGLIKYLNENIQQVLSIRYSIAGYLFGLNETTDFSNNIISDTPVPSLNDSYDLINEINSSVLNFRYDTQKKLTLDDRITILSNLNSTGSLGVTYNLLTTLDELDISNLIIESSSSSSSSSIDSSSSSSSIDSSSSSSADE